jgi:hypothetical protein
LGPDPYTVTGRAPAAGPEHPAADRGSLHHLALTALSGARPVPTAPRALPALPSRLPASPAAFTSSPGRLSASPAALPAAPGLLMAGHFTTSLPKRRVDGS